MSKIWLMTPDNNKIQVIKYDFNIRKYFPNNYECKMIPINDIFEYYVIFFDAEDGGYFNNTAKWIAPHCGVVPTGNFIIVHKKWDMEEEKELTVDMDISVKDFKKKYLP